MKLKTMTVGYASKMSRDYNAVEAYASITVEMEDDDNLGLVYGDIQARLRKIVDPDTLKCLGEVCRQVAETRNGYIQQLPSCAGKTLKQVALRLQVSVDARHPPTPENGGQDLCFEGGVIRVAALVGTAGFAAGAAFVSLPPVLKAKAGKVGTATVVARNRLSNHATQTTTTT